MDDVQIIALLCARDERALEELTQKYKNYCYSIFKNVGLSEEDCEECMNDLLFRVWSLPSDYSIGSLRLFLAASARNAAINKYKESTRTKRGEGMNCEPLEEMEAFLSRDDVESVFENNALRQALNDFLRSLDDGERALFIFRYFYLEDTPTLAAKFGVGGATVLRRLSRTRKKLKKYLETEGFDL